MVDLRVIDCVLKFIQTNPERLCFIYLPRQIPGDFPESNPQLKQWKKVSLRKNTAV